MPPRLTAHPEAEPLPISRRLTAGVLVVVLLLGAALLTKQIACATIATRDAAAFYLPLADAAAEGKYFEAQHPIVPPVYPMLIGLVSRLCWWAEQPTELTGRLLSAVSVLGLTLCVFFLGRAAGHTRVGLVAAALAATNPRIIRLGAAVGPAMLYALLLGVTALLLIRYRPKGALLVAVGVGLFSALATLTRSEGMFLLPLVLAGMLIVGLRAPRSWRLPVGLLLAVGVMALVLWPRVAYLHSQTGYPVLDARMLRALPLPGRPDDQALWRAPIQVNVVPPPVPSERNWSRQLVEAKEGLLDVLDVIGYWTVLLALVWLICRRHLQADPKVQAVLGAIIIAQLLMVAPVKMDRRYVGAVAPLGQIWAGLGAVALAERFRLRGGRPARFGKSIPLQLAALGVLAATLACYSLLGSNQGVRHSELRPLGEAALERYGPVQIFLAATPDVPYYARGRLYAVPSLRDETTDLSARELAALCRQASATLIVIRTSKPWCSWLLERITAGDLPSGVLVADSMRGDVRAYLIDAERLLTKIAPPTPSSAP